ncbi:TlpA family protein disulfide reductase [Modicisalibacter tunisiensis]|uniref:TlpA family protein disulfide reductase n=1 Tax=Modicisalibacter tunisiensis TaxID=390637 RepID=A0ABS7X2V8_9GAMM|nr:TlpA disulfide reductase family protein [Modicisalibacter tunisiensis]MBZ9569239.1 TlpA family protein disulfide reductase [Modicisalibacter tunisiensis]
MSPLDRSLAIGPLVLPLDLLLLMLACAVALGVATRLGRRRQVAAADHLFNGLLLAMITARLAFVLRYRDSYASFLGWFDIRDGGFEPLAGVAAGLGYWAWRSWRHSVERRPLAVALLAGLMTWSLTAGPLTLIVERGPMLPDTPLTRLDGSRVSLPELVHDDARPLVVNLWASWCPPCRREMPLLAQAQQRNDEVTFVFLNQGESLATINGFLQRESLTLDHLYRDPHRAFGKTVGAVGIPTTLYYDASGQLVDTHLVESSRATLSRSLERLRRAASP